MMKRLVFVAAVAVFPLAACTGVQTDTVQQSAYSAFSAYDAALAAADTYLCSDNAAASNCVPRPVCTGDLVTGCVDPNVKAALQTTVAQGDQYVAAIKLLLDDGVTADEEPSLQSNVELLRTITANVNAQIVAASAKGAQ